MAFRLVGSGGDVTDFAGINLYASGTIRSNMVVDFIHGNNTVTPASSSSTVTTVFGMALQFAEGASDTQVRVVPFTPGQIWEADGVNLPGTIQIGFKHALYGSNSQLINNTSYDQSGATGVFFCLGIAGSTTAGSARLLGFFIPANNVPFAKNSSTWV